MVSSLARIERVWASLGRTELPAADRLLLANRVFRALVAPQSYAVAHGSDAIIGSLGSSVAVVVEVLGRQPVSRVVRANEQRTVETSDC